MAVKQALAACSYLLLERMNQLIVHGARAKESGCTSTEPKILIKSFTVSMINTYKHCDFGRPVGNSEYLLHYCTHV